MYLTLIELYLSLIELYLSSIELHLSSNELKIKIGIIELKILNWTNFNYEDTDNSSYSPYKFPKRLSKRH
jgi:hypothetical protein